MRTTVELPEDLLVLAKEHAAREGRAFQDLVADALKLLLQTSGKVPTSSSVATRKRKSAGTWARRFTGVASLPAGETREDARSDHYRKKYGV